MISISMLLPGATIGMLGGGQLGRMFAFEAKRMGYRVIGLDPTEQSPLGQVCDEQIVAAFDDVDAALELAERCDVITYEFENIHVDLVKELEKKVPVYPGSHVLEVTQHRVKEKEFVKSCGLPVTDFLAVDSEEDLVKAMDSIGFPAVLKTCRFGYDGKGQRVVQDESEAREAFEALGNDLIWEKMVPFEKEVSVICVRNLSGETVVYPVVENDHVNNILDVSFFPARVSEQTSARAIEVAKTIAQQLNVVGTFATEMFVLPDGDVLVNEIAPRPHNSGHVTIETAVTSQFEQQFRAVCGLPLGSTDLVFPGVMANILGDGNGNRLHGFEKLAAMPRVNLHLYGKAVAKDKRKMGHITAWAETLEEAHRMAMEARETVSWGD